MENFHDNSPLTYERYVRHKSVGIDVLFHDICFIFLLGRSINYKTYQSRCVFYRMNAFFFCFEFLGFHVQVSQKLSHNKKAAVVLSCQMHKMC